MSRFRKADKSEFTVFLNLAETVAMLCFEFN